MKDELIELLELLVDVAMTSDKTNSIETETLCQSTQFTQESQLTNNGQRLLKTKSDVAGKQRPKKALK